MQKLKTVQYLNTSNVNVNLENNMNHPLPGIDLNTSNVNVNQQMCTNIKTLILHLNTSNVNVNL